MNPSYASSKEILVIASDCKLLGVLETCVSNISDVSASGNADKLQSATNTLGTAKNSKYSIQRHANQTDALAHLSNKYGEVNLDHIEGAVVFVDLLLEDCDGLSLIEKLRNNYHHLPIIAYMSERSSTEAPLESLQLRSQAEACGADAVLLAPINLREVISTVTRLSQEKLPLTSTIKTATSSHHAVAQ